MTIFEAIILGLLQGLTEFLPVSSSGHLEIGKYWFGINPETSFYFTLAVHAATVLSTVIVFWPEVIRLISGTLKLRMNDETRYVFKILISMIPIGVVGIFFKDEVAVLFNGDLVFIGFMLAVTSLLLTAAHFMRKGKRNISYLDAFIIGIAQTIAVIPGISRSGATISTGLLLGNSKDQIARFSFLMVLIPIIGANILEIFSSRGGTESIDPGAVAAGFLAAFISGYAACRWMIALVKKSKLIWFSVYCIIVGITCIFFG